MSKPKSLDFLNNYYWQINFKFISDTKVIPYRSHTTIQKTKKKLKYFIFFDWFYLFLLTFAKQKFENLKQTKKKIVEIKLSSWNHGR